MKKLVMILLAMSCFFVGVTYAESMTLEYDGGVHQYSGDVYELEINDSRLVNLPLQPKQALLRADKLCPPLWALPHS